MGKRGGFDFVHWESASRRSILSSSSVHLLGVRDMWFTYKDYPGLC